MAVKQEKTPTRVTKEQLNFLLNQRYRVSVLPCRIPHFESLESEDPNHQQDPNNPNHIQAGSIECVTVRRQRGIEPYILSAEDRQTAEGNEIAIACSECPIFGQIFCKLFAQ